jgi:hypothetical protein
MDASTLSKQQRRKLRRCEYGECVRYSVFNRYCRVHAGYASQVELERAKVAAKHVEAPAAEPEPTRTYRTVTARDWVRGGMVEMEVTFDGTF